MSMTSPLVSVLIPVYNGENFVADTLESVCGQTYQNLQIIVVDDCSTDQSRSVIERFAENDPRIQPLFLKENGNVCKASNLGYQLAQGKYVALIGHDDLWESDKIEKQVSFMETHPEYAVCFTLCHIIDDDKNICDTDPRIEWVYQILDQRNTSQKRWVEQLWTGRTNAFCAPSALIRRSYLPKDRLYHYGFVQLQDCALWLELLIDHPIYILQERLTLYRQFLQGKTNLSMVNGTAQNRFSHEMGCIAWNYIKNMPDDRFRELFGDRFQDKQARTAEELLCERAFLLRDAEDFHCIELFADLFDRAETRELLEEHYHFSLGDYYTLSTKPFYCDKDTVYKLKSASVTIRGMSEALERAQAALERIAQTQGK
jgi:hypothetical protein